MSYTLGLFLYQDISRSKYYVRTKENDIFS